MLASPRWLGQTRIHCLLVASSADRLLDGVDYRGCSLGVELVPLVHRVFLPWAACARCAVVEGRAVKKLGPILHVGSDVARIPNSGEVAAVANFDFIFNWRVYVCVRPVPVCVTRSKLYSSLLLRALSTFVVFGRRRHTIHTHTQTIYTLEKCASRKEKKLILFCCCQQPAMLPLSEPPL